MLLASPSTWLPSVRTLTLPFKFGQCGTHTLGSDIYAASLHRLAVRRAEATTFLACPHHGCTRPSTHEDVVETPGIPRRPMGWMRGLEGTDVSHLDILADSFVESWGPHMGRGVKCCVRLRKEHLRLLFKSRDEVLLIRYDTIWGGGGGGGRSVVVAACETPNGRLHHKAAATT